MSGGVMFRWALLAWACLVAPARAQPVACDNDSQCDSGYYCLTDAHACHKCLRCEDLNREPPPAPFAFQCITSITKCGACLKGLVDDQFDASCKKPTDGSEAGLPPYVWVIVVVMLLLFAVVVGALVYMLRYKDTFKISTWTGASVHAPVVSNGVAPTAPPPYNYNAEYTPVRASSPTMPSTPYDPEAPLVKRAPAARGVGGRESAGSQNARVFSNPAYVRNAHPPPSYESGLSDEVEPEGPFVPLDEDTVESPWTPGGDQDTHAHTNGNGAVVPAAAASAAEPEAAGAVALPARRPDRPDRPDRADTMSPPPKIPRVSEDSNNNSSRGGASASASASFPPGGLVINVLNVNSL